MKLATCKFKSTSPYSQGRYFNKTDIPEKPKESHDDYEQRTWRNRCHVTEKGNIIIPGIQFCNSLKMAAGYLSIKVPGKKGQLYTKHFGAGVLVVDPGIILPEMKATVPGEWVHVPSDGRPGGRVRVPKCFPKIEHWEGTVPFIILDDLITEDIFGQVVKASGDFIGVGRWRPINRGLYGRFKLVNMKWEENYNAA
jgi:hypothetical protein